MPGVSAGQEVVTLVLGIDLQPYRAVVGQNDLLDSAMENGIA
jgi:hypothetical protein